MDTMHARMKASEHSDQPELPTTRREIQYTPPRRAETPQPVGTRNRRPRWLIAAAAAVVALVLLFGAWRMFFGTIGDNIDHGKYQAVFLTSSTLPSNVYFGKLERMDNGYFKLTNVYYLQNPTNKTEQSNTTLTVVKMTKEAHAPEDAIVLPREQILYYQNMTNDSKVVQFIKQDSQKN